MSTYYVTKDGDMLDAICWAHYGSRAGTAEAVLNANPGLAAKGPVLTAGTVILLPDVAAPVVKQSIRMWD
ncbi:MAG: tail protein X [Desulfovibrionaceae bacterium]